ncbi:hypothetical protein DTO271D3_6313 [Paecilomyces variotii]|nr:hypothetical protein DTO271D3_6313 [Paecilomyces variotii]
MAISIADSTSSRSQPLSLPDLAKALPPKQSMWQRLGFGFGRWLGRDDSNSNSRSSSIAPQPRCSGNLSRRITRRVGVSLPRAATFKRQNSERRDRLAPVDPSPRRAVSADRRPTQSAQRTSSPQPTVAARLSAPEVQCCDEDHPPEPALDESLEQEEEEEEAEEEEELSELVPESTAVTEATEVAEGGVDEQLELELEKRWILNLSMHFRDKSEREKFFVTYAETPNRWRRVTVSCDYRGAPPDSLEQDLKELHYQRDKSARIYESIRESLPDIQFYNTVTNLKLQTSGGRLHVHVTEDVNEIIPYPAVIGVRHLNTPLIPESHLIFDTHLSGFVYKVQLGNKPFIKKEIPGPDTVDEFLYEINALHDLQGSQSVIQLEGIIVDDQMQVVKGLLIGFAEQGALVDIIYERRGDIDWARRERWAKQIVQGLCEIHEAGYVQGDFTLSNIVVDGNDNAKIIDINRRGCPVGWEPPEIATKIESNQRISMYIGVKSDIFQLGMTLWAIAMQEDEPERQNRPLTLDDDPEVPDWYKRLVATCLSKSPKDRLSAKELLSFFPQVSQAHRPIYPSSPAPSRALPLVQDHAEGEAVDVIAPLRSFDVTNGRPINDIAYLDHSDLVASESDPDHQDYPRPPQFTSRRPSGSNHYLSPSPFAYPYNFPMSKYLPQGEFDPQVGPLFRGRQPVPSELRMSDDQSLLQQEADEAIHSTGLDDQSYVQQTESVRHSHGSKTARATVSGVPTDINDEAEIDLDETVDPLYRDRNLIEGEGLEPIHMATLPGELAGVGANPACTLGHCFSQDDIGDDKCRSKRTYCNEDHREKPIVNDFKGIRLSEVRWPRETFTPTNPSLLDSRLPINPAFRWPGLGSTCPASSLINSRLPINPAFTTAT